MWAPGRMAYAARCAARRDPPWILCYACQARTPNRRRRSMIFLSAQGGDGFMYSKEEMLQIYKDGHYKNTEFADRFQQVPNATTPEFLIPLALLPIGSEEAELRLNPVVVGNPQGPGGRGREGGKGFDREGGKGKGKGERGGKGEREGKGGKGRDGDGWGRNADRDSGGGRWDERGMRGERSSNGERLSETAADIGPFPPKPAAATPAKPAPPKDWYYRDLQMQVQGPFTEAQISEWFTAGYLPADLQMRPADGPAEVYTRLADLIDAGNGEPPFVRANRIRSEFEAEAEAGRGGGGGEADAAAAAAAAAQQQQQQK